MNKELKQVLIAALNGVSASANFSAEDTDRAAINAMLKEIGIDENSSAREIRAKEDLGDNILGGRVIKVTDTKGWYGVKTMANGDAGFHYVFLG